MTLLKVYNRNGHCRDNDFSRSGLSSFINEYPFGNNFSYGPRITSPRVNISEEKDAYRLIMEVPGIEKNKLQMNVVRDILTISYRNDGNEGAEKYTHREFSYRNFERSFRIPESVETEKISASYSDGILDVLLPKKVEAVEKGPRNIEIS